MRRGSVGLERLGVIRGPRERTGPFKEWLHLCATGPSGSLLLNLSFERVDGEIRRRALVIGRDGDASVVRVVQPRAAQFVHPGAGNRVAAAEPVFADDAAAQVGDDAAFDAVAVVVQPHPARPAADLDRIVAAIAADADLAIFRVAAIVSSCWDPNSQR